MEVELPPILISYFDRLVEAGKLQWMRKPHSLMIPDTSYHWSRSHYDLGWGWVGPDAYNGLLPLHLRSPWLDLIKEVHWFGTSYQRHLDAEADGDWASIDLETYNINPERRTELESVKTLCDQNKWAEAIALYRTQKETQKDILNANRTVDSDFS